LLDVRSDGSVEQRSEGLPGGRHSNRNREGDRSEHQWRGPHGGAVYAADGDKFVNDQHEEQDADSSDGSSGRRQSDAGPGKAAESGGNQTRSSDQNKTLVRVGSAPCTPCCVDDNGEADDADRGDRKRNGGLQRTDPYSAMKRVDSSHHAEHDHNRRKAESDRSEGTMPFDAASGDECGLNSEQQHPEGEDRAVEVKDGARKRRAHHAGLEVSWREADEHADAEQDRHATVENAFDGSIDRSVHGLSGGCRRKDGIACHGLLHFSVDGPDPPEIDYGNAWTISCRREVSHRYIATKIVPK
jgi:hypothetical protein